VYLIVTVGSRKNLFLFWPGAATGNQENTAMRKSVSIFAVVAMLSAMSFAAETRQQELDRVKAAGSVLSDIMSAPDKGIPAKVLADADCVAVVPSMLKAGFVFGARYGKGVATCHHGNSWSAPAPFRIEGGSFGLQIGGEAVDLVMLVMNKKGMDQLLNSKFKIGADVSGAAGPVGRQAEGSTDWKMRSEVLTYSRARGAFAGVELNGAAITQDQDDTHALYGKEVPFRQILSGSVPPPSGTQTFLAEVQKYFREAKAGEVAGNKGNANEHSARKAGEGTTGSMAANTSTSGERTGTTTEQAGSSSSMSTGDVKGNIEKALRGTPGVNSGNVNVNVTQDTVQLSGTVPSDNDKNTVRKIAEDNAGGRKVVDSDLTVK
jgi:SH3 domain-containing YSC84-like protein 1